MPKRPRVASDALATHTTDVSTAKSAPVSNPAPPAVEISEDGPTTATSTATTTKPGVKSLSKAALEEFNAGERRKGVVYLSRIPPGMKPIKLRHLLSRYGEVGRLYLAPEDAAVFRRRVSSGGSRKLQFVEGWVEFMDKHVARATASAIHATAIGESAVGKAKRDHFASELWNIQYLKHFKWHHLTEKVAYERRIKVMKLRMQLAAAKKESEAYLSRVDQAKALDAMKERKKGKSSGGGEGGGDGDAPRRQFKQRKALGGGVAEEGGEE